MTSNAARQLLDDDGENLAVRAFLTLYGDSTCTVGGMRRHMTREGFPYWPDWVGDEDETEHLTKYAAQDWLRHLFALERVVE